MEHLNGSQKPKISDQDAMDVDIILPTELDQMEWECENWNAIFFRSARPVSTFATKKRKKISRKKFST